MRRLLTVAAAAAVSVGLLVPAADAATTPIVSYKGLPSDWEALSIPCVSGTPATYNPAHVNGPIGAPAGTGSLRVAGTSSSSPIIFFGPTDSPLLSTLSAFDAYVYIPTSGAAIPEFDIEASDGSVDYSLHIAASGTGWQHVDLTGTTVLSYDSFDNQTNTEGASGTTTLSDFVTAHSTAVLDAMVIAPTSCGLGTYYLDDVHYAAGTTDNTVDFEAALPTSLVNASHPTSVLTGTSVKLGATLTQSGTPVVGATVSLYAHSASTTTYHLVKSLVTDANGAVSYTGAVSATTTYQWRYAGANSNNAPATATAFTIASRQRVTVSSKPTTVLYRGTAVIKGRIVPTRSGVVIRLVRIVSGKRTTVATTHSVTGGYFTIKEPMTVRGIGTYVVTAASYTGEATGQSSSFKITTK